MARDRFSWGTCSPETVQRIVQISEHYPDYSDMLRVTLDLTVVPQHKDPRLFESTLVISSSNMGRGDAPPLYIGPYREHLIIHSVPHRPGNTIARVAFWAVHEDSGTCTSWHSKNASTLFGAGPLIVELYDSYNAAADAWYRIYPNRRTEEPVTQPTSMW